MPDSNNKTRRAIGAALTVALAVGSGPADGKRAGPSGGSAAGAPRLAGAHYPVFSLLDNRLLAHLVREGGLLVPAGRPGMAKYITFMRPWNPWRLNHKEDGRATALAARNVTWLRVPLTAAQAKLTAVMTLSLKSPAAQGLSAKINQTKLRPVRLSVGWQRVEIAVAAGAVWSGENRIELAFGAAGRLGGQRAWAAVEYLHLGARGLPEGVALSPAQGQRLLLPAHGGLAYYVHPYAGAKLRARMAAQGSCALRAALVAHDGKPVEVTRPAQEGEAVVDLSPIRDRVGRLELTAEGSGCKSLALEGATIVMPGGEPKLKRDKAPKHVLFWMIDNARADRYTLYNPKTRVRTPVITELGRTGTVFARAYIQGTESRVSHASIWTGLYPKQHRFIAPKAKLSLEWVTLPEAAKKAGLTTIGIVANGWVSKFWGFGEGWHKLRNHIHQKGPLHAAGLADMVIEFYQEHDAKKPSYVYVGTIDPHVSWRGRQPWLKEYHPEPYDGPYKKDVAGKDVEKMAGGSRQTTPADRKRIIAIYDSTVSYNDQHLGRVLDELKKKKMRDDTMVVITSDHGEELWDYGKVGHGCSLKQQLVAVPLIVHYPPLFGRGVVVKQGVDVLSVMASVLDAIGAPIPDTVQGESLLPLAQGIGAGYPRPSIATQYELAHAIRLERWKLWTGGKGEPMLFDLESRQGEHHDIAVNRPLEVRWLGDALGTFLVYQDRWRKARWGVASNGTAALAEDLETGGGPGPLRVK
jgi:arylsulfatase A-like enzyme